ncbi:MAG: glycosyltransferase family 2 protein [Nitrospirae bacterium]|nr:glycosyltransferase family 2 protein [Nitrospirota bacterium]
MYKGKKISVVFPIYNEEENIRTAIDDFFATDIVDELIAVDNNSSDNSANIIKNTKATYLLEKKQGYGNALIAGLKSANGDIIFTCEPDGTFIARDVFKFLQYIDEFDVVFGTRTSKSLIWSNAKMNWFFRFGNLILAKLLEYLHNGPCLTDVGCSFKAINKDALQQILPFFSVGGSAFSPEFMGICIKKKLKNVEIPVNYKERIGQAKITSSTYRAAKLGIRMIFLILHLKFRNI